MTFIESSAEIAKKATPPHPCPHLPTQFAFFGCSFLALKTLFQDGIYICYSFK
jgi:hypothetical protein